MQPTTESSVPSALVQRLHEQVRSAGGWLSFAGFMEAALYTPGLGYYAGGAQQIGVAPHRSDFVTAPELSPWFARALAVQVGQALEATGTHEVWEFGAGTGALAAGLLEALGERVARYTIVDLSGSLRARQRERLAGHGARVRWLDALPERFAGVVVGNEVLDAMPVSLLARVGGCWHERGVVLREGRLGWADRPTALRPPVAIAGTHDYLTEHHGAAQAFVRTLVDRLQAGALLFIDYGFPAHEYFHPQRDTGTLMCHRAHRADTDPLQDPGEKDITAHVDFTGLALAAQEAGDAAQARGAPPLHLLGYTSQARFLINCGLVERIEAAPLAERAAAHRLLAEHEMGELFKVILFARGPLWDAQGFRTGDRSHRL